MHRALVSGLFTLGVALAGGVSAAEAQESSVLITSALQLGTPNSDEDFGALCTATNVTFQARRIQLLIYDGQGIRTVPATSPTPRPGETPAPTPTPIAAFESAILGDSGYEAPGSAAAGLRYCVVIVDGEPDDVRATMCLTDLASGRCVVSSEAR
jgi:hypothetical protein